MVKAHPTRESFIETFKKADAESDKPVGASTVCQLMGISPYWIKKLFPGESLTRMKRENRIRLSPPEIARSKDELLSLLDDQVSKKGILSWNLLQHKTGISEQTWKRNVGGSAGCSKEDVYISYQNWLKTNKPNSPNLEIVRRFLQSPHKSVEIAESKKLATPRKGQIPIYRKAEGRIYGRRLDFRNMTFEPTNEQGVVFLFGMISEELGFDSIEYLGADFPDCEGKRRVGSGKQLQPVKIEFEFKSRSYDHAIDGCDMIVCWEDNWKDCPLEVIELKKKIKELPDKKHTKL